MARPRKSPQPTTVVDPATYPEPPEEPKPVGIAEIRKGRKQLLLRVPTFKKWYWFVHISPNGETIAKGEEYTQKHNVTEVLAKYYPTFEVKDVTGE